jgi:hypothetical protein
MVSQCIYSGAPLGDSEEIRETPVTTGGILGDIRTGYLPDTNYNCYRPSQLTISTTPSCIDYWINKTFYGDSTGPWIRSMTNWLTDVRVGSNSCVTVRAIAGRLTVWRLKWIYVKDNTKALLCLFLPNFLLLCLCILIVCLCMATLTEVLPCFFLSRRANARVKPAKTGHGRTLPDFCVVLCIVYV